MPNWCNNQVSIAGPNKVLKKFMKIVNNPKPKAKDGLFEMMKPMPKELRETTADGSERIELIKKYGHSDWYGWANSNWGTKWGCCDNEFKDNEYWFNTAWCPLSTIVFEKFSKDIPNFKFIWEEEQGFGQKWECKDGVFTMIEEWDMPDWNELLKNTN